MIAVSDRSHGPKMASSNFPSSNLPAVGGGGVAATVTVVLEVTDPVALVAVKVKFLLEVTFTTFEVPVTVPTPWSMDNVVARVVAHDRVTSPPPTGRLEGVAVNEVMVGASDAALAVTVNVNCLLAINPGVVPVTVTTLEPTVAALVAVRLMMLAFPVVLAGLKLTLTPAGTSVAVKATAPSTCCRIMSTVTV